MIRHLAASVCCLFLVQSLGGCKTPIEIKSASKQQLQLLQELDNGVASLQRALADHHRQSEERAYQEGRILIAQQAIAEAVSEGDGPAITADELFSSHKDQVQFWIDVALTDYAADLDERIMAMQERIDEEQNELVRGGLKIEKQDLELLQARLQLKPVAVASLEEVIVSDIDSERQTLASVKANLKVLRAQIAVMKAMAEHVDTWLAIDLSPSTEQIDSLQAEMTKAAGLRNGGGQ